MHTSIYSKITYAFVIPYIFILISPLTIFFGNPTEYDLNLSDLIIYLLSISILIGALILFCFLITGFVKWESGIGYGIVVGIALAALLQSQFLVWDFGPLDGRVIDWSRWNTEAIFDAFMWIVVCCLCAAVGYRSIDAPIVVARWVLLLGALSLASAWITSDEKYAPTKEVNVENLFKFHSNNNKLLIIVDTWQSDVFYEVLNNFPKDTDFLQGFKYFPDTVGGYPTTKASVPLILSGRFYENEMPFNDWVNKNVIENNIVDFHSKRGFGVAYAANGLESGIHYPATSMSSLESRWSRSSKQALAVINTGLFRAAPTSIKPMIYDKGLAILESVVRSEDQPPGHHGADYQFMKVFDESAYIGSSNVGEFKVFHLRGAHYPLVLDEHYRYVNNMPNNRSSYVKQVRGTLFLLRSFLNRLKELDIYYESQIVIVGDHGTMSIMPEDMYNTGRHMVDTIDPVVLATSRPVFLHKPRRGEGNLTVSDEPMHLSDVVCLLSNWDTQFDCPDLNSTNPTIRKIRRYLYYKWRHKYWDEQYLPPMIEYNIVGNVSNIKSWIPNVATFAGNTED